MLLVVAALVIAALMMFVYYRARDFRRAAELQAEQNERNQQAILRLLDELSSLADGDLTVQATVTEDITGAIADSINYAIDALRELVTTINDSSILVDAASKQTEGTARHLVRSAETQAKQAAAASESMARMAVSIEEVSGNAERCSDVARHSVEVAHKGGEAVRRTIAGMNTIRETIQDTSKRIKRLGESSQEIGNIVELIEEIAEQTNILALNASIEASRAGEASRGFAVVADEVQKLAERSANATKKIEVLVSTIQSDTNEAVMSMERSTTDVVGGALLAENAGAALDEIEQVSHQIASLVHNISGSSKEQTSVAGAITKNMHVLREISTKTTESTTAASSAISKLSELASQLRRSVAGLHAPGSGRRYRRAERRARRREPRARREDGGAAPAPAAEPAPSAAASLVRTVRMATHTMDDLAAHSFELVNRELASTLDAARRQLEDYVDGRSGADALLRTAEHLHLARGALKIVEIHGAALLAEEMEQTCRRLAEATDEQKVRARTRSADARDGAATRLSRATARRRQRRRVRAAAAAERSAPSARQALVVRRHARAAERRPVRAPNLRARGPPAAPTSAAASTSWRSACGRRSRRRCSAGSRAPSPRASSTSCCGSARISSARPPATRSSSFGPC